jgi:hypothetical protein
VAFADPERHAADHGIFTRPIELEIIAGVGDLHADKICFFAASGREAAPFIVCLATSKAHMTAALATPSSPKGSICLAMTPGSHQSGREIQYPRPCEAFFHPLG